MKKILFFFVLLIPFLSKAQSVENIYLAGSTGSNKVIARNDFAITGTTYLGLKDTTFSPIQNGAIVCRSQDGKLYEYISNPGNQQWWALGIGVQNIGASNLMHARNDSTFVIGGKADTTTVFELSNTFSLTIDSAIFGANAGFRVNFTNDQPWDLFMRDSITGFWRPLHKGTVGYVLSPASTGGYAWVPQSSTGSPANLMVNPTSTTLPITNSNGTGITLNSATHSLAGAFQASDKAREDSTTWFVNYSGTANFAGNYGDSLAFSSVGKDTIGLRRILLAGGVGVNISDSSTLQQIYKTFNVDTNIFTTRSFALRTYLPFSLTQGSIWVGNSSGVAAPLSIGTNGQVPVSTGTGIVWQNPAAGFANPMTILGDIISQGSSGPTRLPGNTSATTMLLKSLGNGTVASAPVWYTPGAQDISSWQAFTSENVTNKSTTTTLGTSNSLYPTQNAVKTYVDNQASATLTFTNKTMNLTTGSNIITGIPETSFNFTNNSTANATTGQHGLLPILPGGTTLFLNGSGAWTAPLGSTIYNSDGIISNTTRSVNLNNNTLLFLAGNVNMNAVTMNLLGQSNFIGNIGSGIRTTNTIYDNGFTGSGGTRAAIANIELGQPSISALNTNVTYTNAATLYIDGAPITGTNATFTNPWAFYVAAGKSSFNGTIQIKDGTQAASYVFTSDANGNGSWQTPNNIYNNDGTLIANRTMTMAGNSLILSGGPIFIRGSNQNTMYFRGLNNDFGFNIGRSPNSDNADTFYIRNETNGVNGVVLQIDGPTNKTTFNYPVRINDGTQANNKVLTSDANGNASWQTAAVSGSNFTPPQYSGPVGTVYSSNYTDINHVIEVNGMFSFVPSTTGTFNIELAVPISTTGAFSNVHQILGSSLSDVNPTTQGSNLYILNGTNSTGSILLHITVTDTNTHTLAYHYSYYF